jgi:hypothetical protein
MVRSNFRLVTLGSYFYALGGYSEKYPEMRQCERALISTVEDEQWEEIRPMVNGRKNFAALTYEKARKILVIGNGFNNPKDTKVPQNRIMEVFDVTTG